MLFVVLIYFQTFATSECNPEIKLIKTCSLSLAHSRRIACPYTSIINVRLACPSGWFLAKKILLQTTVLYK